MFPIFMRRSAQYEGLEGAVSQSPITRAESLKMVIYLPYMAILKVKIVVYIYITLRYFKYPREWGVHHFWINPCQVWSKLFLQFLDGQEPTTDRDVLCH